MKKKSYHNLLRKIFKLRRLSRTCSKNMYEKHQNFRPQEKKNNLNLEFDKESKYFQKDIKK